MIILSVMLAVTQTPSGGPAPGTVGRYAVLTGEPEREAPFSTVVLRRGPDERAGQGTLAWWEVEIGRGDRTPVRFRALSDALPFVSTTGEVAVQRYLLHTGARAIEYRNVHTGRALLPTWRDVQHDFFPQRARGAALRDGLPETVSLLGHVLTLQQTETGAPWDAWDDVLVLDLDPELLVGTSRSVKDQEGRRLPQQPERLDYTYVSFTEEDYRVMLETGVNLFTVKPEQMQYVVDQPVFFMRSAKGDPPLDYPLDLYRSNYLGAVMFMDEPSIRTVGDKQVHNTLLHFSDFAELVRRRVARQYAGDGDYGAYRLDAELRARGTNLGAMRIMQHDYPSWETMHATTYYQMEAGCAGLVHEGRYQLDAFARHMHRWTGKKRRYTPEEYLRYEYALLRGGVRPFGKHWGTAIYGQADPALSPLAVTLAYDMGARYVWFWTSDHDHHLPWHEQLELVRILRAHAKAHPRPSIAGPLPARDTAIAIPDGYFLSLPHGGDNPHDTLWWVRELDPAGENEASQRYRRLMERAHRAVQAAMDAGEDYDLTIDDGRAIEGYRKVVRITLEP